MSATVRFFPVWLDGILLATGFLARRVREKAGVWKTHCNLSERPPVPTQFRDKLGFVYDWLSIHRIESDKSYVFSDLTILEASQVPATH